MLNSDEAFLEFLAESRENLDKLDQDFLALEANPHDAERIATIFRAIHTIKGTSGFFGLDRLEELAHAGENVLARIRDGSFTFTSEISTALLAMIDRIRMILNKVETEGSDSGSRIDDLVKLFEGFCRPGAAAPEPPSRGEAPAPATEPPISAPLPTPAIAAPAITPTKVMEPSSPPPPPATASAPQAPRPKPSEQPSLKPAPKTEVARVEPLSETGQESNASDTSVRVDVALLDRLMNLVGELVLARNQLAQFVGRMDDPSFLAASQRLNQVTTELQERVTKTRMQPISVVWNKVPRVARDISVASGKQVRIEMRGKETELDRALLDAIRNPVTHIVRNAIDHGIELPEARALKGKPKTGTLLLRAFHEGGQVNVEISDDGNGLNLDAIRDKALMQGLITGDQSAKMSSAELMQLVFLPGFSTATQVTNVSGRGVGMDVVKTDIEKIGGTVDLDSSPGKGTTVRIKIPLTLAIVPALIVRSAGHRYAIPQASLVELVRQSTNGSGESIELVHGSPVYRLRGKLLPLVSLNEQLKMGAPLASSAIVVLSAGERQFGVLVDDVIDTEEIVVKPLSRALRGLAVFAGATIMGDGQVALIIDVIGLASRAKVFDRVAPARSASQARSVSGEGLRGEKQPLLLFALGSDLTMAFPLDAVSRLEELPAAKIERTASGMVAQYRGDILPLVDLKPMFGVPSGQSTHSRVIVHNEGERRIGFVVDKILDVVEAEVRRQGANRRSGVLGSIIVQDRIADVFDIVGVMRDLRPVTYEEQAS